MRVHRSALEHVARVRSLRQAAGGDCFVVLHDGTEARLLGRDGAWLRIEIPEQRQGWVLASEVAELAG